MTIEIEGNIFFSPREFSQKYSWPTPSSLRWHIHQNSDGFRDRCIKKRGGRIWISQKDFELWLSEEKKTENYDE